MDISLVNALREMLREELNPINKRLETVELEINGIKEEHGVLLRGIEEKLQIQSKAIEKIEFIEGDIKAMLEKTDDSFLLFTC